MFYCIVVVKMDYKYTGIKNSKLLGQIFWTDYRCTHWGSLHCRREASSDPLLL